MPGVALDDGGFADTSGAMVDCEEEREKVLASGPSWVSLNSVLPSAIYAWLGCARSNKHGSTMRYRREITYSSSHW